VRGLLACGVRFGRRDSLDQCYSCDCPMGALEHGLALVADDTFEVLAAYRQPPNPHSRCANELATFSACAGPTAFSWVSSSPAGLATWTRLRLND